MRSILTYAAAMLAVSEMARANEFYPDIRDSERRQSVSSTFKYRPDPEPGLENVNLLGKSHGKGSSKRTRRRK